MFLIPIYFCIQYFYISMDSYLVYSYLLLNNSIAIYFVDQISPGLTSKKSFMLAPMSCPHAIYIFVYFILLKYV